MKICFLLSDFNFDGGGGRYARELVNGVRRAGHETIILTEQGGDLPILGRGAKVFISALKARKYFKKCDVIHALDIYPYGVIAYLANIFLDKKLIITAQGTYSVLPFYNLKIRWLARLACRQAHILTAISIFTKKKLLERIFPREVLLINHGVNLEKFYQPQAAHQGNFILGAGALKNRKGYHIAIPAFALAKKKIPDLQYFILGNQKDDPAYFEELKKLAVKNGVGDSVKFIAGISESELLKLYRDARLFILTSINIYLNFEGFGLVFLEAAAAGLPVIGTKDTGIEDAVSNNFNGILVPQNDIEATAQAIIKILTEPELWQKMSQHSYAWAKEHDWESVIKKYLEFCYAK
ncbi:glycosyltransferase family 4 protein [Patescibacteria group bacterium]|nr:glycosyltransferase family 4 protein [Patescibacteria group bacterium]